MTRAYVLMTAMPPTKGHLSLLNYAASLDVTSVEVILATQPGEPFEWERVEALQQATRYIRTPVNVYHLRRELPQEPAEADGFWDMWAEFLSLYGMRFESDVLVASEKYGYKLAQVTGAKFMPYDVDRFIRPGRATNVRNFLEEEFDSIIPEFQHNLRMRVTIFGADSCGKTTLTKDLASVMNGWSLPEWARPYLETVGPELSRETMLTIAEGQTALQASVSTLFDRPYVFQDTDLFTTIGYWDIHGVYGAMPASLPSAASTLASDLYVVARSNIAFEEDPLRYGGDAREATDQWWIDLLQRYELPYVVLDASARGERITEAVVKVQEVYQAKFASSIAYERRGNG